MPRPSPLLAQALQLFSRGAYPQAIKLLQQVIATQPAQLEPRLQLAKACLDFVSVLAGVPLTDVDPDTLGGEAVHHLQLAAGQLQILEKSHPASPHVQQLLAMLHIVNSEFEAALRCLKKALAKDPRNPELLYNLGYTLIELERDAEAAVQLSRLTALYPSHGMGWQMLAQALRFSGNLEASLPAYRKAVSLLPTWFQPYGGLSGALTDLARPVEAKEVLRTGLSFNPSNKGLNFNFATLSLATGDWATGWRYYLCRAKQSNPLPFPEGYVFPLDKSRPVRIYFDQGLGDELFFLRFAPVLKSRGYEIAYTCQAKLFPLLEGMPIFTALNVAESLAPKDFDVLVGELPFVTGMCSAADIPPPFALRLDAVKVDALRRQLESFGPPPYLGVTWRAGTVPEKKEKGDWQRLLFKEIPAASLGTLARDWPGTVVVMQRLPTNDELAQFSGALGKPYLDWSRLNDDLQEALAGLSLLDEYAGVSNTNMHLRAGIGKGARVLVPFPAEWRWMAEGKESPWFPGFRIYRQDQKRDWATALGELGESLRETWG